jgi:hypothetical protein
MTDINPTWRMEVLTDMFGPCGIGWRYEIGEFTQYNHEGEVAIFASVTLYVKDGEEWSFGIPGIGGSLLVAKEKNGLRLNDEAYKMAVTDAVSVAAKALGVGAQIYMGNFDGSKYRNVAPEEKKPVKPLSEVSSLEELREIARSSESPYTMDELKARAEELKQ